MKTFSTEMLQKLSVDCRQVIAEICANARNNPSLVQSLPRLIHAESQLKEFDRLREEDPDTAMQLFAASFGVFVNAMNAQMVAVELSRRDLENN